MSIQSGEEILLITPPSSEMPTISIQLPNTDWDNAPTVSLEAAVSILEEDSTVVYTETVVSSGKSISYTRRKMLKHYLRATIGRLISGDKTAIEKGLSIHAESADNEKRYWAFSLLCRWLERQEPNRDTRELNAYCWFLRQRFLCIADIFESNNNGKQKLVLREYRRSFRDWLKVCFYEEKPGIDNAYFFDWAGLDREREINRLVFKGDNEESNNYALRKFFTLEQCLAEPNGIRQTACLKPQEIKNRDFYVKRLLDVWFPCRYDLKSMRKLLRQYSRFGKREYLGGVGAFILSGALLSFIRSGATFLRGGFSWVGLLESIVLGLAFWAILPKVLAWVRVLIPRLTAAILVGYAPLLFSKDMWKTLQTMDWQPMWFILLVGVVGSFIYFCVELAKSLDTERVLGRAWRIWLIGIIETIVIGVIVSDVLGKSMGFTDDIQGHALRDAWVTRGFFGFIYWRVIASAGAMALLLGVILQMIWEDKPVTEPI